MRKLLWVFIVFLMNASLASAQRFGGYEINQSCQTNSPLVSGYVAGAMDKAALDSDILYRFYFVIYDQHHTLAKVQTDGEALGEASRALDGYCVPSTVTVPQIAEEFCKFLGENHFPSEKSAAELLGLSLKAAWPCK